MIDGGMIKGVPGMLKLSRRHFVIGCVFATASGVAFAREPKIVNPIIDPGKFEGWVPRSFHGWRMISQSGVVLPPPDATSGRLYDNLATRVYVGQRQEQVMLLLAYNNAQDGVLQVHRPETCYPVGGFALSDSANLQLPVGKGGIPAKMFTAYGPDRVEQVMYFTRLGDDFPRSWVEQRLSVAEANLRGEIPDGMLMRFSIMGAERGSSVQTLTSFAQSFIAEAPAGLRRLLIGSARI